MTRTGIIVGGVVGIIAMLAIALLFLQRNRIIERGIRRRILANQRDVAELATEMQRTDHITTVLCGTASPLARDGAQTCTAVFFNGQFLLFDAGDGGIQSTAVDTTTVTTGPSAPVIPSSIRFQQT